MIHYCRPKYFSIFIGMEQIVIDVEWSGKNYAATLAEGPPILLATGGTKEELETRVREAIKYHLVGLKQDREVIHKRYKDGYELVFRYS